MLHELLVALPHEDFLYLGDTARFPYGTRPPEELQGFALHIARGAGRRAGRSCSSSPATRRRPRRPALLEERFAGERGVDVIARRQPGGPGRGRRDPQRPRRAAGDAGDRRLAAPTSARSRAADPHLRLTAVACPDLAPIIQAGFPFDEELVDDRARATASRCATREVDTVILGCTHYPLIRPMLQRMLGRGVTLVTPGRGDRAAGRVRAGRPRPRLRRRRARATTASCARATTDDFRALGTRFLQLPLGDVEHVDVHAAETVLMDLPAMTRSLRPRARRSCGPSTIEPGLRPHRDRLGADLLRRDARDLHRVRPGVRARAGCRAAAAAG